MSVSRRFHQQTLVTSGDEGTAPPEGAEIRVAREMVVAEKARRRGIGEVPYSRAATAAFGEENKTAVGARRAPVPVGTEMPPRRGRAVRRKQDVAVGNSAKEAVAEAAHSVALVGDDRGR